jgi:hypothetical protein
MPGWQITLITAGAAVLAALLGVTADRPRAVTHRCPGRSLTSAAALRRAYPYPPGSADA